MRLPFRTAPPSDEAILEEVFAYVSRRVRPREESEDVTAETMQAALAEGHRLRGGDQRLWVLGIARRKTADARPESLGCLTHRGVESLSPSGIDPNLSLGLEAL